MLSYYGYTISPNQIETGEGFLICRNVPIARIGTQEYLGSEIGLSGSESGQVVKIFRSPSEVFSPETLASFEGKPVTNDHPPDLIGPDDVTLYEKGHAQNVRRGSGEWTDYILADLHIHDRQLIEAVKSGKREISCGYECEYMDNGDGTYSQKNIRGNHVAVVNRGRAGKRAAILDSDKKTAEIPPERKGTMKSKILELFGLAAKDKTPDEIAQMALDAAQAMDEVAEPPLNAPSKDPDKKEGETKDEPAKDENPFANMDEAALDALLERLASRQAAKKAADCDPISKAISDLEGAKTTPQVVEAEGKEKGQGNIACSLDQALAAGILKNMRPVVASIEDEKTRLAVADALIKCVTSDSEETDIAKIMKAAQNNSKMAADKRPDIQKINDEVQANYDSRNPHRTVKKEAE